jgi:hypothetical protein
MLRLDYLSCMLTVISTVLVGKKLWQGWVIAGANSLIICIIGMRTAQFGFVPANLFCIGLYANNLWSWRSKGVAETRLSVASVAGMLGEKLRLIRVSLSGEQWPDMQTRKLQQKSPVLPEAYALPGETIETRSSSYVS